MNKSFLAVFFVLTCTLLSAQPKLGLKFSPQFTSSRVLHSSDTLDIEGSGSKFKFSIGLIVDQRLTDTYYLSTGLIVMPKQVGINIVGENGGGYKNSMEEYQLQYIQIPLTLKLYTNEIAPDVGIYFQVGGTLDFKIFDAPVDEGYTLIQEFNPMDASALLGAGGEFKVGINTVLFAGATYQRGLINSTKETTPNLGENFYIRNGVISIDLGIKF